MTEHHPRSPILLPCLETDNLFPLQSLAYETNNTEEIILCYLLSGLEKSACLLCSLTPSIPIDFSFTFPALQGFPLVLDSGL